MSSGTVTANPLGSGKNAAPDRSGFLASLDGHIARHQRTISLITAVLAVLGIGATTFGLARVSPVLKLLYPF
jgi:hypothetical protein